MGDPKGELVEAVHAEFQRVRAELEPGLIGRGGVFESGELRDVQYAQNTLRTCIEAVLQLMLPYTQITAIELAIRLGSYALSIVPMEDQDFVVAGFMESFVMAHERRLHNGVRISTDWRMADGRELPNFPEAIG